MIYEKIEVLREKLNKELVQSNYDMRSSRVMKISEQLDKLIVLYYKEVINDKILLSRI